MSSLILTEPVFSGSHEPSSRHRYRQADAVWSAELCEVWKRHGHMLGFGVGISLGYATVGLVGSEGRYDYTASGTVVNLAARLCEQAEDGDILLSLRAFAAVEQNFAADAIGKLTLKGLHAPIEVYRVRGAR